jgi:uracil-DNA glycosylase
MRRPEMNVSDSIKCIDFPCTDIDRRAYTVPGINIDPQAVRIFMVSEAPPPDKNDYFYSDDSPFYLQTTIQAFNDAGVPVSGISEILDKGVYITTAVKCGKTGYSISTGTIRNCSALLEKEISLFPDIEVFLLMGDVAIKSMNYIWKKQTGNVVIPASSTYKLRKQHYYFKGKRVFPSYLQTGKNYLIEKSKRRMIAEDIRAAMGLIQ